eukprot:7155927-Alexandrium_andersonii.AAC.1
MGEAIATEEQEDASATDEQDDVLPPAVKRAKQLAQKVGHVLVCSQRASFRGGGGDAVDDERRKAKKGGKKKRRAVNGRCTCFAPSARCALRAAQ